MRAKGGRRKAKEVSFCEDSVPRSAPQPANRGLNSEAVSVMPAVPELSLMFNGIPRPGVHLLQKPGSSGFIARAPASTITPRLSARAIEKVPTNNSVPMTRIIADNEGAVGGIITKEEADAMEFFRELNAQFEEKNRVGGPGDPNNSIIILDKCMRNGNSKKDKQRVRAAIVASTMSASSPMPPPPRPTTAHLAQPSKAKPSVPELSVLENIPKNPSAIVVSAGGRSVKKVNFEEYVEFQQQQQQQQQPPPPHHQQQQSQQRPKPRKFTECERAMLKFQLESAERRILELEMELSKLKRKKDNTRERGIQAPIVRDKSTQVSPEILAPFKNTKKSKKRGDRNGMENLKIIIPTPIPKEQKPKPADEPPIKKHDPSSDAITQEKLLKALTQINSIFSASRQHDPEAAAIAAASAKVVASVSSGSSSSGGDEEAASAVAAAAARNIEARAARVAAAATATTTTDGAAAAAATEPAVTATATPTTTTAATAPVFTTGIRTHAMAAQVVRAAFLKATTTQRPTVPLGDRSFVMKQLAAKYLPEWQNTLVVRAANEAAAAAAAAKNAQQTNENEENKKPQQAGGASGNSRNIPSMDSSMDGCDGAGSSAAAAVNRGFGKKIAAVNENPIAAIDNLRNYKEFPFDSDDDNELNGNEISITMSSDEKDLLQAFHHRKIMMADGQGHSN